MNKENKEDEKMDIETETKNEPQNEEQPVKEQDSERFVPFQFVLQNNLYQLYSEN